MPDMLIKTNGLEVTESAKLFARSVGGMLLGLALINWYARNDTGSETLKGVLLGNIVVHVFALITDGLAVQQHVITENPWFGLLVHAIFIVGFGYYYWKLKKT